MSFRSIAIDLGAEGRTDSLAIPIADELRRLSALVAEQEAHQFKIPAAFWPSGLPVLSNRFAVNAPCKWVEFVCV